ncbi:MAG: hypothetical protein ACRDHB_08075 [Actinomycetota bacterium]
MAEQDSFTVAPRLRRRWPASAAAAVGLAVVVAASAAWVTRPTGPDVALAVSFEEGRTYRYAFEVGMDGTARVFGGELPFTMDVAQTVAVRVVDVDDRGAITLETEIEALTGTFNGMPMPSDMRKLPSTRVTIMPDGRVVTEDGLVFAAPTTGPGGSSPMTNQLLPMLPDHPVGPGDTWEIHVRQPVPFGRGRIEFDTANTFVRYHEVGDRRVAVIDTRVYSPIDFELNLADLANVAEQTGHGGQLPSRPVPDVSVGYLGEVDGRQVSWVDPDAGEVVKATSIADVELESRTAGGPTADAPFPGVAFGFSGEMTMEMRLL